MSILVTHKWNKPHPQKLGEEFMNHCKNLMINSDVKPTELRIWVNNNWRGVDLQATVELQLLICSELREGGALIHHHYYGEELN